MDPLSLAISALGGLAGGGETKVTQSASNASSVSLSVALSNLSPGGTTTAPATGGVSSGTSAGSGADQVTPSPLTIPYDGSLTDTTEVTGNSSAGVVGKVAMIGAIGLGVILIGKFIKRG